MKIGIIGGGITGLTACYRLSQKKNECWLFEKAPILGGRLRWSAVVGGDETSPYSIKLIKELNLQELQIPLKLLDGGIVSAKGEMLGMEKFSEIVNSFTPLELQIFEQVNKDCHELSFDIRDLSPRLEALRKISFDEYARDWTPRLKGIFGAELINIRVLLDWKRFSADYGLFSIKPFFTSVPQEKAYLFEENMIIIANILAKRIFDAGSYIFTSSEVKRIVKSGKKFVLIFEKEGREKKEKFDKIILTVPLPVIKDIFPELPLESNIEYTASFCYTGKGELKHPFNRRFLFVEPGHPSNIALLMQFYEEHRIYPLLPDKEIDPSFFYEQIEIDKKTEIEYAWPVVPASPRVPSLKAAIESVYLAGDFYYYPSHDTAVQAAEAVSEMIQQSKN